jgi:hypothetical protein
MFSNNAKRKKLEERETELEWQNTDMFSIVLDMFSGEWIRLA